MTSPETVNVQNQLGVLLPHLHKKYGVGHLWIVGSRARGDHRPDSDLDLLVEFERRGISLFGYAGLILEIEDALGLTVDLVERDNLRPELAPYVLPDAVPV